MRKKTTFKLTAALVIGTNHADRLLLLPGGFKRVRSSDRRARVVNKMFNKFKQVILYREEKVRE